MPSSPPDHMLQWDMTRAERFQLPLLVEYGGLPAPEPMEYARSILDNLTRGGEGSSRFVREVREQVQIRSGNDAAQHLMQHIYTPFDQFDQEEMWTLLLDTKNVVTHEVMVYRGTLNTVYIRLAEVFKEAVRVNAASFLLSHCHPSGEPTPSPEDVRVTERLVEVGQLLDIPMLDHIVVGRDAWVSMKEKGLGFR